MDELYVVFDQIPLKKTGGLVATYVDFVRELSSTYQIVFVSVFRSDPTDIDEFKSVPTITLFDTSMDNRFYKVLEHVRAGQISKALFSCVSALKFFAAIPLARIKTSRLLVNKKVVAVAPAAAMFLSKHCRYILEIHIDFGYFWGSNILGRSQSALIHEPALTVFRSQADANKGKPLFSSSYLYNTFDASGIPTPSLPQTLSHRALFMGRLSEQKNPLLLLDCAEGVASRFSDFQLHIFGDGPLRVVLEEEIARRGLGSVVLLKGFTDDKSVYQGYDMLWLTSKLEGLCLAIVEASANMVPTVSSNWGDAVHEEIIQGKTGYVADDVGDFVSCSCKILGSLRLRNELARNARTLYEQRFSPSVHRESWLRILSQVYGSGR